MNVFPPDPLPLDALFDTFRRRYPFSLDPFQEEAIQLIARGTSVIVSAPTGAGKTLIAEFAIVRALQQDRRIAYTTPLKALSNQKYADFCRQFGEHRVGILTGDVKVNPGASILVMTTEILRNMFYLEPPQNLAYVVLDECHYMGDEGRGTVWEEIIINCPKEIQLVALSATVSNIGEISDWIGRTHRPIAAIHHPIRPVPLQYVLSDRAGKILPLNELPRRVKDPRGFEGRHRPFRRRPPDSNCLILELHERGWLPAIYFIFSRSGCERALEQLLEQNLDLLEASRRPQVEEVIQRTLLEYPSIVPESPLNSLLLEGLRHGAGVHHAGILPALKRLTEVLFERGLVKVVFATETMSLGIHMPAKSVVIQSLRKRSEYGFRTLTVSELTQMAGRAGRRGIDPEGKCVVAFDSVEALDEVLRLIRGKPEPIESRFRIGYSSAALLLSKFADPEAIRRTIEKSFGQFQNQRLIRRLESEREEILTRLAPSESLTPPCCDLSDLIAYQEKRALLQMERRRLHSEARPRRRKREAKAFPWSETLHEARARVEQLALELSETACHRCPERPHLEKRLQRSRRLQAALEQRREQLKQVQETYWDQFLRVARILEHFGYLEDGSLSVEGRLIASLRHDNELLVARVLFAGTFDRLKSHEIAALLSCLIEEPRETETLFSRMFLKKYSHLRKKVQAMQHLAEEVERIQKAHQVALPVSMHVSYLPAAYRWAAGEEDWLKLVQDSYGGHEGDLIRAFRRLIDLCRQLEDFPGLDPTLRERLHEAIPGLDRGIVLESALI
ncbi:MAG: DEAD/DEAH box helicase [candidate division NC10 bacterium]|nr:DEAD/DEAH box helicase [candidate division NC10 bacterium]